MERDILVDGYNIIKNSPSFRTVESRNLEAARNLLISQLVNRYRHTPHQVIVVFDGDAPSEQVSHYRRICIIFSKHDETADSVIARLAGEAQKAGREVELYSNDEEVRQAVAQQGGSAHSTERLTGQLNAAPRDIARRFRHRQAMIRKYGLDPAYDPDEDGEPVRSTHGKKKKARRRR